MMLQQLNRKAGIYYVYDKSDCVEKPDYGV